MVLVPFLLPSSNFLIMLGVRLCGWVLEVVVILPARKREVVVRIVVFCCRGDVLSIAPRASRIASARVLI